MAANVRYRTMSRLTIGFLIDVFYDQYQMEVWTGVSEAAEREGINLVCFCGGAFNSPYENDARAGVYELIQKKDLDGLIALSATIGNFTNRQELKKFYSSFYGLPLLSVGSTIKGVPSIVVESDQSMFELVAHCIQEHGCRRIAFIKGTDGNEDAVKRFAVYKAALSHFGIAFNGNLVVPGDFVFGSGQKAVSILFDERKVAVDVIIGANDLTAVDVIETLAARGIRVPDEVKVVGFDNIEESRHIKPALTTVSQPSYTLGYRAVLLMKEWIKTGRIAELTVLPTCLKIRQSCGCLPAMTFAYGNDKGREVKAFEDDLFSRLAKKLGTARLKDSNRNFIFNYAHTLYSTFSTALKYNQPQIFLDSLENIISENRQYNLDLNEWCRFMEDIFQILCKTMKSKNYENTLNCLNIHFNELLRDLEKRECAKLNINAERIAAEMHRFSQKLIITFNMEKLKPKIIEVITKLGIKKFFIAQSTAEKGAINNLIPIIVYDAGKEITDKFQREVLSKSVLIEKFLFLTKKQSTYIVMPLFIETELLGFLVFEPSLLKGIIYENFTVQLSSALKSAFIVEELEHNASELKESLHEKDVLLQEIHHRVKNNLQIILSLMNFQMQNIAEKEILDKYNEIKDRIKTIALIHEELLNTTDLSVINFKSYICSLTDRLFQKYAHNMKIIKDFDIQEIFLDIQTATPCGLIINEIITNSILHAFKGNGKNVNGRKIITLKIKYLSDKKTLEMLVGDNGIGLPRTLKIRETETMGLQLVTLLVQNQLEGKIKLLRKNGTYYQMSFIPVVQKNK